MKNADPSQRSFGSDELRRRLLHGFDAIAWTVALAMATATRLSLADGDVAWGRLAVLIGIATVTTVALATIPRFHSTRAKRGTIGDVHNVTAIWAIASAVVLLANFFVLGRPVPTIAAVLALPLALTTMLGLRLVWRTFYDRLRRPVAEDGRARVLVFGAGEGGEQIIRAMQRDPDSSYVPVGVLDDDPNKAKRTIESVPVVGTKDDIADAARRTNATELLIAIPKATSTLINELDELGREAGLEIRILPSTSELLGLLSVGDIRELTEADLLGRDEVNVDLESIRNYVDGKRVLVTGAGGSIGSELCRQISGLDPAELYMLDHDETNLHSVQLSIEGKALLDTPNLIVASIRDAERIDAVFADVRPEVVFHTAALKHLTLLENHPEEAVKTNVWGTANLLDAAMRNGVDRFVNVSTDKAADPTSMLGASKLVAERLTALAAKESGLPYVSVRFGNVLGSRGSVLPTFRRQIAEGGPITVTHPDVTRYFMTIPEAVRLVLQAGAIGRQGEIMILDMGEPVKIADLAERLIKQSGKDVAVEFTGLRPGEKLHEILVGAQEVGVTRDHDRITHTAGSTEIDVRETVGPELANALDIERLTTALDGAPVAANSSPAASAGVFVETADSKPAENESAENESAESDIPFFRPSIGAQEHENVEQVLLSGWLTSGPNVREFEARFAEAVQADHAIALNSATAALHLSLVANDIGPGDEVIVPSMTFAAGSEVVIATGATPVLVDVLPETLAIDPACVREALTDRTRAIMPMHYGGVAADLDAIAEIALANPGMLVLDDAAHAFPAYHNDRPIGGITDGSSFSFYANKTMTTGEGGMFTTNDGDIADRVRRLSLHGLSRDAWNRFETRSKWDYDIVEAGWKYNLTDVAAGIGLAQLDRAYDMAESRRNASRYYDYLLSEMPGFTPVSFGRRDTSACHLYSVRVNPEVCGFTRDDVIAHLGNSGIGTSVHYRPLHMHTYHRDTFGYSTESFPVAAQAFREIVSLPLFPGMSVQTVDRVIATIRGLAT